MPNSNSRIDGHNKKILENTPSQEKKTSNRLKKNWPNKGTWLTENVLYYPEISWDDEKAKPKLYKRIYGITFNKR